MNDPPANRPVIALRTEATAALSPEGLATFHRFVVASFNEFCARGREAQPRGCPADRLGRRPARRSRLGRPASADVSGGHSELPVNGGRTGSSRPAPPPDRGTIMGALAGALAHDFALGALSATEAGAALSASREWTLWRGRTGVETPTVSSRHITTTAASSCGRSAPTSIRTVS